MSNPRGLTTSVSTRAERTVTHDGRFRSEGGRLSRLSKRQFEVLSLLAAGLTNQGIADRLGLSVKSVNNHVNALYIALELQDKRFNPRVCAVRLYLDHTEQDV